MPSQYAIGIDLGTTNSVLAYAKLGEENAEGGAAARSRNSSRRGRSSRGTCCRRSCTWGPRPRRPAGRSTCRGSAAGSTPSGRWPGKQAADVPTRTVAAAKIAGSPTAGWTGTSRSCPWNAPAGRARRCRRSRRRGDILQHLVAAWTAAFPDAPIGRAAGGADGAGVVRRQRPRTDARGGAAGRAAARPGAARRAAGGAVRLAGRPRRRLAAAAQGRRHAARRRRRRRHHRLHPHRRHRGERRTGPPPHRRRQPHARRRRQHGPGPRPLRRHGLRREGRRPGPVAVGRPLARLPQRQGSAAGRQGPEEAPGGRAGPRQQADRRHGLGRPGARGRAQAAGRRLLPRLRRDATKPERRRASRLPRDRPAVRDRHRHHPPPGRLPLRPRHRPERPDPPDARAVQRRRVQGRRCSASG